MSALLEALRTARPLGNLRAVSVVRMPAQREVTDAHQQYAIDRVLADVDSFSDFLAGACAQVKSVDSEWSLRLPHRIANADVPTLLHAAIVSAGRRDDVTCADALRIIVQRYLDDSQDRVRNIAEEVAE